MKFTKAYLQTLSTDALLQIADQYGIFLSADVTRRLIIGELLDEQNSNDSLTNNADAKEGSANLDANQLPQSYNVTQIHILLRNPMWFFAFWDFHEHLFANLIHAKDFLHFFLRIHALKTADATQSFDYFDIEIPSFERKRYVYIAFDSHFHRIDLMVRFQDNREQLLAQSNVIEMKRTIIPQRLCISQNNTSKIMNLSGLLNLKKSHFQNYRQAF